MKSVPKLIRRFVGILLLSTVLLFIINIGIIVIIGGRQLANGSPYTLAKEAGAAIKKMETGYVLPDEVALELRREDVWAILIDEDTRGVVWQTDNLPGEVPRFYTLSDISDLSIGYVEDYPTYAARADGGLLVLGFPKDSFWKHMWPSWDYDLIANLPMTALKVVGINLICIFLIYVIANTRLLKSVEPITKAIQDLPTKEHVYIKEKGVLSEIAVNINRTSDILRSQEYQLRKKETARANWIAGVSHDIRTPLSMVMGHAGRLLEDEGLSSEERLAVGVIVRQSERIRNLINDLNLASKLEYNMQPLAKKAENVVAIVRQVAVDFMNTDVEGKYPIEWTTEEDLTACIVSVDKDLLKRAVANLVQNCMNHNEDGCAIRVGVRRETAAGRNSEKIQKAGKTRDAGEEKRKGSKQGYCVICVEDDGVGASVEEIEALNHAPHYMLCDTNATGQRHGLGLLIVKQIAAAHGGTVEVERGREGGLAVRILLPGETVGDDIVVV